MAKQLTVRKKDGLPAVECPRCEEVIIPIKNPIGLDGYECSECDQVIDSSILRSWRRAMEKAEEEPESFE